MEGSVNPQNRIKEGKKLQILKIISGYALSILKAYFKPIFIPLQTGIF